MDVTRSNFNDTLPVVKKAIDEASFIAFDAEFSGLTNGCISMTNYDSPEDRYQKIKRNTGTFTILQFGICTFKANDTSTKYATQAFNFYIFPFRSNFPGVPDRVFSCQSSSIDFLSSQNFDFNKVFHTGIPYLRPSEEAFCRSSLEERHIIRTSPRKSFDPSTDLPSPCSSPTPISDHKTKGFVDLVCQKVDDFLKDPESDDSLKLDPCNSYLRKILYETVPKRFNNSVFLESRTDERRQRYIAVVKSVSDDALQQRRDEERAKDEAMLEDAIGFSKIIRFLADSNKLILGHNCLLDIVYLIQQFVSNLPQTLEEFKSLINSVLPKIIDTKLMASMLPFKDQIISTALGDMYTRLQLDPFGIPDIAAPLKYNQISTSDNFLHEAAYDAYITGVSFLGMLKFLHKISKPQSNNVTLKQDFISPYCNKLFLMRSPEIPYLNLAGADLTPTRAHVFHIHFPAFWKTNDIRQLFLPVTGGIQISWINDNQCFVGLYNKSQIPIVKKLISQNRAANFTIRAYDDYQKDILNPQAQPLPRQLSQNKVWVSNNHNASRLSYSNAVSNNLKPTSVPPNPYASKFSPAKAVESTTSEDSATSSSKNIPSTAETVPKEGVKTTSSTKSDRKRHGEEPTNSEANGEIVEPKIKRQKSQECIDKQSNTMESEVPVVSTTTHNGKTNFEVPEW